jgi:DNA-directed RNA polymerase specialized sigma24 family protein
MQPGDDTWLRALNQVGWQLRRHSDAWTREHRDDLLQEAALASWQWAQRPHDPKRFWSALRTITRRVRSRALWNQRRQSSWHLAAAVVGPVVQDDRRLCIGGISVSLDRARQLLADAMGRLRPLDRQLLEGVMAGFCCAELAARFRRSEPCVKTRLHRARLRVQRDIETHVRWSDGPES